MKKFSVSKEDTGGEIVEDEFDDLDKLAERESPSPYDSKFTQASMKKLFQKAIAMEDSLSLLHSKYREAKSTNDSLESRIEKRDRNITETRKKLSRALRDLESMREVLSKKNEELENLKEEVEFTPHYLLNQTRLNRERFYGKNEKPRVGFDRVEELLRLQSELELLKSRCESRKEEISGLKHVVKQKEERVLSLMNEKDEILRSEQEKFYKLKCETSELKCVNDDLYRELKSLKNLNHMKSESLEKFTQDLSRYEKIEDDHGFVQKKYSILQKENERLQASKAKIEEALRLAEGSIDDEVVKRCDETRELIEELEKEQSYLKRKIEKVVHEKISIERREKKKDKRIDGLKGEIRALLHIFDGKKKIGVASLESRLRKFVRSKMEEEKRRSRKLKLTDSEIFSPEGQKSKRKVVEGDHQLLRHLCRRVKNLERTNSQLQLQLSEKDGTIEISTRQVDRLRIALEKKSKVLDKKTRMLEKHKQKQKMDNPNTNINTRRGCGCKLEQLENGCRLGNSIGSLRRNRKLGAKFLPQYWEQGGKKRKKRKVVFMNSSFQTEKTSQKMKKTVVVKMKKKCFGKKKTVRGKNSVHNHNRKSRLGMKMVEGVMNGMKMMKKKETKKKGNTGSRAVTLYVRKNRNKSQSQSARLQKEKQESESEYVEVNRKSLLKRKPRRERKVQEKKPQLNLSMEEIDHMVDEVMEMAKVVEEQQKESKIENRPQLRIEVDDEMNEEEHHDKEKLTIGNEEWKVCENEAKKMVKNYDSSVVSVNSVFQE